MEVLAEALHRTERLVFDVNATADGIDFVAVPVPLNEQHRIARDRKGGVAFLFRVEPSQPRERPASIILRRISADFDVSCRISRIDGPAEVGNFAVLRWHSEERYHVEYFLRLCLLLLQTLPPNPSSRDIARLVDALADILRITPEPERETLLGFWAELLLIAESPTPMVLIDAWRQDRNATYDFASETERLELKCAIGPVRKHHFSLTQLCSGDTIPISIASMLTESCSTGPSIRELLNRVREIAADNALRSLRIERVLVSTLGESAMAPLDDRFDDQLALRSLAVYQAADIPKPGPDIPPTVTQIRFCADLSGVVPSNSGGDLAQASGVGVGAFGHSQKRPARRARKSPPTG